MLTTACRDYLLEIADLYRTYCNLAMSTVSNKFYGNAKFFDEYRAGNCSISIDRYQATVEQFREKWPKGLKFPKFPKVTIPAPKRGRV